MQGPEYLFFLKETDTGLYYRVENGVVLTGAPTPLQFSPSGWKTLAIANQRNTTYFALDRSFTTAMDFVEDGGQIVKYVFYNYGFEKNIEFIVARQTLFIDPTTYGYEYELFYQGEIDLSTFVHDGEKASVSIMEGGILKYIKANQNTKYEVDIDVPDAVKIKMDGIKLQQTGNFAVVDGLEIKKSIYGTNFWMPTSYLSSDGQSSGISFLSSDITNISSVTFPDKLTSNNWVAKADDTNTGPVTVDISGKMIFTCHQNDPSLGFRVRFLRSGQTLVNQNDYQVFTSAPTVGGTQTFNVNLSIPLQPGERLYLEGIYFGGSTGAVDINIEFLEGSNLFFKFSNTFPTTYIKGLQPLYALKQIINQVSNGLYTVKSNLLTANDNFLLTCGDAIRSIAGSKIKTSLADFFQSMNVQFDIGMGVIAGMLQLEEKVFFVDYTNPIFLGEASNMKVKVSENYTYNTMKVGYPEQNYDAALGAVNGKLEFNNTFLYTTPVTRKTKELNLVSVYRADCFGIEFTRINLDGKTTTDNSSDNDVFIIHANKAVVIDPIEGPVYTLNRDLNPTTTGVIDPPSVFNEYLSPGRCLKRSGRFVHSCFYKQETGKLVFQTTEKNEKLATTLPGGIVERDAGDVEISTLLAALFKPISIDIDVPSPEDLFEILDHNPVKAFSWTYYGVLYMGIPDKVSCEPYTSDKQTYTLLSAPSNDLTPLIDIYE